MVGKMPLQSSFYHSSPLQQMSDNKAFLLDGPNKNPGHLVEDLLNFKSLVLGEELGEELLPATPTEANTTSPADSMPPGEHDSVTEIESAVSFSLSACPSPLLQVTDPHSEDSLDEKSSTIPAPNSMTTFTDESIQTKKNLSYWENTLDVLFLLYETQQEQVHNRNHISCTHLLKDSVVDIANRSADEVEVILMHFLTTDPKNHKMIVYVGHSRNYCHLECGQNTILSEERYFQILEKHAQTSHLYLAFLCSSLDYYLQDRIDHEPLLKNLHGTLMERQEKGQSVKLHMLWDRTMQRHPTSFLGRQDFQVFRKIEEEITRYRDVRFYEE
jgi:hypothetical protein